jgi:prepilin-type N-terminal cleavage/methylation domain-containing protein
VHNFKNAKSGFSLPEMMVVLFIFTLVLGGLLSVFAVTERTYNTNKTKTELQQELRKSLGMMVYDLRQAGPAKITNVPADDIAYTTITFQTPADVNSGTVSWNPAITYALNGSQYVTRTISGVTKVIAQNINSLTFTRLSASSDVIRISMQAQKKIPKGTVLSENLVFNIQLRN